MKYLYDLIPDAATLKGMTAQDVAGFVLESLCSVPLSERGMLHRRNFIGSNATGYAPPREPSDRSVMMAMAEGWAWLEANQLIVKDPEQDGDWYAVTARGREVANNIGVERLIEREQLPASFVHPALLEEALPQFMLRRFDTAVFKAFHELEVSIREAAGFGVDMIGRKLASAAFHPESGPLTDQDAEAGERQSLMNLMAGALGSYKNPQSHRRVGLDAAEAREMLILASHLLGIVENRAGRRD